MMSTAFVSSRILIVAILLCGMASVGSSLSQKEVVPKPTSIFYVSGAGDEERTSSHIGVASTSGSRSTHRTSMWKANFGKKMEKLAQKLKQPSRSEHVFGKELEHVVQTRVCLGGVPTFVISLVEFLREHGLHLEGLFRVSGSADDVAAIKKRINKGDEELSASLDPHAVVGVLKAFLRGLPEPLLTFDLYDQLKTNHNDTSALDAIEELLPESNRLIGRYIFQLLNEVAMNVDTNSMSSDNLAKIFAPTLMYAKRNDFELPDPESVIKDNEACIQVVKHFIMRDQPSDAMLARSSANCLRR